MPLRHICSGRTCNSTGTASHVRIGRIQLLRITPDLADTSGKSCWSWQKPEVQEVQRASVGGIEARLVQCVEDNQMEPVAV